MKAIVLKSGKEIELNQAFNMDCLEFMKELPEGIIDLTVTSPPYDNLRTYNNSLEWNEDIWKAIIRDLYRITKDGGVVVWVVGDATIKGSETGTSFKQALWAKECGFNLHDTMIWNKDGGGAIGSSKAYTQNVEYMFVFSKGEIKTSNMICDKVNLSYGKNKSGVGRRLANGKHKIEKRKESSKFSKRNNYWYIPPQKGIHPAVFPDKLARDHIISWSNKEDIVFDPFGGSFTTAIQADKENRTWIICEKVEDYFKSGYERYNQETKQILMEF
ncbi:MAG: site-specific DNA-methyltransferase [Proteobacteria bacterium]|nr:site-specific DNA-methyltransferase [Pseudomonadota bacterium]